MGETCSKVHAREAMAFLFTYKYIYERLLLIRSHLPHLPIIVEKQSFNWGRVIGQIDIMQ